LDVLDAEGVPGAGGAARKLGALDVPGAALLDTLAGDSGSGRGLLTWGASCAAEPTLPGPGITVVGPDLGPGVGPGIGAARGTLLSGGGARPGPSTKTWPTEMWKSAPMLFHRAKSRKSRS
jgi:hypothetical protein